LTRLVWYDKTNTVSMTVEDAKRRENDRGMHLRGGGSQIGKQAAVM
jgi:hypothetical protein